MIDIRALGYFVAQTDNLQEWQDYAENVLGMMTSPAPDGGLYIKMDERPFRMLITEGTEKRYVSSGWELASQESFKAATAELDERGIAWETGDQALCNQRAVQELALVRDPSGNLHELFWGHRSDFEPFTSPQGIPNFVTGDQGLGHTVIPAPNFEETLTFLTEVMGFGVSDLMKFQPAPDMDPLPIYFMHCNNPRHHSLAICGFPVPSGCVHTMVEVETMTEVGRAHDRMQANNVPLSATLGEHLNDEMTSFYMKTPSGFDMEFGYGGLQVDWEEHSAFEFTRVSRWGHDFTVGRDAGAEE